MKQYFTVLWVYFIINCLYALWSFSLTDPNLVLTSWEPYWLFQHWLWALAPAIKTESFILLVLAQFYCFTWLVRVSKRQKMTLSSLLAGMSLVSLPLFFSYNALSHDVFNYLFNARMVVKYGTNPHLHSALEFAPDDWLRFMHNVHTPAPYWYGWTALSLPPYVLGLGKFTLTWLLFRIWSWLGLVLTVVGVYYLAEEKKRWLLVLFALNPLVLIELVSNSHNDGWMMGLAVLSLLLVTQISKHSPRAAWTIVSSLGLLLSSISTKYVTVLLVPFWLLRVCLSSNTLQMKFVPAKLSDQIEKHFYDLLLIVLFLPLLTARSQWFHPWYLVWSLSFVPLTKSGLLKKIVLLFSFSSLLRYVPWMWFGAFEFTAQIQITQRYITWTIPTVFTILLLLKRRFFSEKQVVH